MFYAIPDTNLRCVGNVFPRAVAVTLFYLLVAPKIPPATWCLMDDSFDWRSIFLSQRGAQKHLTLSKWFILLLCWVNFATFVINIHAIVVARTEAFMWSLVFAGTAVHAWADQRIIDYAFPDKNELPKMIFWNAKMAARSKFDAHVYFLMAPCLFFATLSVFYGICAT